MNIWCVPKQFHGRCVKGKWINEWLSWLSRLWGCPLTILLGDIGGLLTPTMHHHSDLNIKLWGCFFFGTRRTVSDTRMHGTEGHLAHWSRDRWKVNCHSGLRLKISDLNPGAAGWRSCIVQCVKAERRATRRGLKPHSLTPKCVCACAHLEKC